MRIKDDRETRKAICSGIIGLIYFGNDHDLHEALTEIYPKSVPGEYTQWSRNHMKELHALQEKVIDFLDQEVTKFVKSTMAPERQLSRVLVNFTQSTIVDFHFEDHIEAEDFLKAHGIADRQIDRETAGHWRVFLSHEQEANFGVLS